MRFEPKSDAELYKLLEKGEYDFEVIEAQEKVSKNGNEMIEVALKVFGPDKQHVIKDWIVDGAKLKRFCESIGAADTYQSGELSADAVVGMSGKCKVAVEESEQYGDRNKIAGYVTAKKKSESSGKPHIVPGQDRGQYNKANAAMQEAANEDIPF